MYMYIKTLLHRGCGAQVTHIRPEGPTYQNGDFSGVAACCSCVLRCSFLWKRAAFAVQAAAQRGAQVTHIRPEGHTCQNGDFSGVAACCSCVLRCLFFVGVRAAARSGAGGGCASTVASRLGRLGVAVQLRVVLRCPGCGVWVSGPWTVLAVGRLQRSVDCGVAVLGVAVRAGRGGASCVVYVLSVLWRGSSGARLRWCLLRACFADPCSVATRAGYGGAERRRRPWGGRLVRRQVELWV